MFPNAREGAANKNNKSAKSASLLASLIKSRADAEPSPFSEFAQGWVF